MNQRTVSILLVTAIAAAGLGLAGCHQKQPSPDQQMKQGADEMGAGMVKKASQAGQVIADSAITTKIKAQLAADDILSGSDINVTTENGVVTLSGTVKDKSLRERAGRIASGTDGVKRVTNDIEVTPQG
jgi:hyperosmotically inducible periplasmic protein